MDGTKILIFVLFYVVPFLVTARKEHSNMKNLTKTQKLTISALCMALYLVVMMCTQSFAFGQYQVRIATALYGLSAIFPFLIIPFGLVNVLANTLMGGLGPLDMLGGGLVGIMTSLTIVYAKSHDLGNWAVMLAITLVPGLGVPVWLSVLLDLPYWLLASTVLVGQFISGVVGMVLVTALERCEIFNFASAKK
jgi:transporter